MNKDEQRYKSSSSSFPFSLLFALLAFALVFPQLTFLSPDPSYHLETYKSFPDNEKHW